MPPWPGGDEAVMPDRYYGLLAPQWLRDDAHLRTPQTQSELNRLARICRSQTGENIAQLLSTPGSRGKFLSS